MSDIPDKMANITAKSTAESAAQGAAEAGQAGTAFAARIPGSAPPLAPANLDISRPRKSWIAMAVAAVAVALTFWTYQQGRQDAQELAKRIQTQENRLIESQGQARLLQDSLRDSQAKLSVMESRVNEAAGQQAQLEKLYRALSNDSIDVALADLESVILLAAQQAASGGSLQGPLIGLQAAEAKLDRLADPSLLNLKRALSKDIERIRLMNSQDNAGLAQKLELISAQVDSLPLLSELRKSDKPEPVAAVFPDAKGGAANKGAAIAGAKLTTEAQGFWSRVTDVALGKGKVVGQDWRDLIRITRVDNPDAALLSPEQAWFVRENLRLRLLNARVALSSRQDSVLKADLERARTWLTTYFDGRDRQVSLAIEQVRQIQSARASSEPVFSFESLAVVRGLRTLRDAKK